MKLIFIMLLSSITLYSFPSNKWSHLSTEHFVFSYNEQTKHLVKKAAHISEEIYDTLTTYFSYNKKLSKISIVLKDDYDYSNGASYTYMPLVEIECRKTQWEWRGEQDWLREALSHELSHTFTMRMMERPFTINLFGSYNSDNAKTEGYIASEPNFANLPTWFVEGLAQVGSYRAKADNRDPFREMLLRDAYFSGLLLTADQMGRFEGSSREYELAYNQGFDFLLFLTDRGSDVAMVDLCKKVRNYGFREAIKSCYNKTVDELYTEWMKTLASRFDKSKYSEPEGRYLVKNPSGVYRKETMVCPYESFAIGTYNHSGSRLDLYKINNGELGAKKFEDVGPKFGFDSEDNFYFTKLSLNKKTGSENYDICRNGAPLTNGKRCLAFDVKGSTVTGAFYDKGITTVASKRENGWNEMVSFGYDTAVYDLCILDSLRCVVAIGTGVQQQFVIKDADGVRQLWKGLHGDVLDPFFAGGDTLFFVSTIDGTPQIYMGRISVDSAWCKVTNVPGGVRYPRILKNGGNTLLRYSLYSNGASRVFEQPLDLQSLNIVSVFRVTDQNIGESVNTDRDLDFKTAENNLIKGHPSLSFGYYYDDVKVDGLDSKESRLYSSASFFLMNAPGNFVWDASVSLLKNLSNDNVNDADYNFSSSIYFDMVKTRNVFSFSYDKYNYVDIYSLDSVVKYSHQSKSKFLNLDFKTSFQTTLKTFLSFRWKYGLYGSEWSNTLLNPGYHWNSTGTSTYSGSIDKVFSLNNYSVSWDYSNYSPHLYGRLMGGESNDFTCRMSHEFTYCNGEYYDSTKYITGKSSYSELSIRSEKSYVGLRNMLSYNRGWMINFSDGAIRNGKINPLADELAALLGYFTGVKVAPMLEDNRISEWYRKWAICGEVFIYNGRELRSNSLGLGGYIEGGFRWSFFLHNSYESLLFFNIRKELASFSNEDFEPYRISFGVEL
ncbi:MAG: hypothetical protein JNL74_11550 [Fibrobacteres bacterium]|nr:hypothetical protein [Fibrobacterota bacterium]